MEKDQAGDSIPEMALSYPSTERRRSNPVEVIAFKNGAKTGLWGLFATVLIQILLLTAFIVTTRNKVNFLEQTLANHINRTDAYIMLIPAIDQKVEDTRDLVKELRRMEE